MDDTYSLMYVVSSTGETGTTSSAERIDGQNALMAVENLQVSHFANFKTFDATVMAFLAVLPVFLSYKAVCFVFKSVELLDPFFCCSCEAFLCSSSNDVFFQEWSKALSLKASLGSDCNSCWHWNWRREEVSCTNQTQLFPDVPVDNTFTC